MEITRKDRWILRNQFLILEGLAESEEDREYWDMCREIVENGYEYHYEWISERIIEDTLSMDESEEVLDILSMFSRLVTTYGRLSREDREEIVNPNKLFKGFSLNHNPKYLGYANFYCNMDGGRFKELGGVSDSHFPQLPLYRKMIERFEESEDKYNLTKDDLIRILGDKREKEE